MGGTKKFLKVGEICDKYDISTVQDKRVSLIGNKTQRSLEMTPRQRYLEAIWSKAARTRIKKLIKKKRLLSDIGKKNMLKVITGEASKGYK